MNYSNISYRIFPLGDTALTIDFGNSINEVINKEVVARFNQLLQQPLPGMVEAIPAYSTLSIYYDVNTLRKKINPDKTVFDYMKESVEERLNLPAQEQLISSRHIKIPVCYEEEFAIDIEHLSKEKNISKEAIIKIHTGTPYKVYMLGFLPGFAYMGEVDERIVMPRKSAPQNVVAGSVGIAGKQTGIYPLASPGGWQIIGRTPIQLFDATRNEPSLLMTGDTVEFYAINKNEFDKIQMNATEGLKH